MHLACTSMLLVLISVIFVKKLFVETNMVYY